MAVQKLWEGKRVASTMVRMVRNPAISVVVLNTGLDFIQKEVKMAFIPKGIISTLVTPLAKNREINDKTPSKLTSYLRKRIFSGCPLQQE